MPYRVTKVFGHELGLSAAFRQWRAKHSHCCKLHGYALSFEIVFESNKLDSRNWVIDFGGLKALKARIVEMFDHKTAVAADDPDLEAFQAMNQHGMIDLVIMKDGVGCEKFAEAVFKEAVIITRSYNDHHRNEVRVVSVKCSEHGANSATYIGK